MRNKRVLVFALAVIVCALAASGTVAYFTSQETARNVITASSFDISIKEQTLENGEFIDYPAEPIKVLPGASVSKVATIQNNDADGFIRCKYVITVLDANGNKIDYPEDQIKMVIASDSDWLQKEEADGWFYYKNILKKGESTTPFTKEFVIAPELENFDGETICVDIIAQGVQADNNGEDVLTAMGWPEEE